MAARLWWMLRCIGHDNVPGLDGGVAKWTKEGRPVTIDVPIFTPLNYPIKLRKDAAVDVGFVSRNLGNVFLVDARAPGRIPGAKNRLNLDNLSAQGTFKSLEA